MDASHFLAFAETLADTAREETMHRWKAGCAAEAKGGAALDFDPVTDADREAERAMRRLIEERFPEHGIAGEEFPEKASAGRWCWSLDPVDGTRSFVCGLPLWVTLIALLDEGRPVLGVIDAPCLGERYMAADGSASTSRTSGCASLAEARAATTDPYILGDRGFEAWSRLRREVLTTRYGLDGYGYARVAAGSLDLVVESGLKPHDYNALIPIVRAAGGTIGDWRGGEDFSDGQVIAAASRPLYDEAVRFLAD
jgi:myo-inositol-1(or 4)-monophosphatase